MKITVITNNAKPGMILYRPVINENGKVVLAEGTVLNEAHISKLMYLGIESIDISLEKTTNKELFDTTFNNTIGQIKNYFANISYFEEVPLMYMNELVEQSIDPLIEIPGALNYLSSIQSFDDYIFQHSLSVATISGILGKWAGYKGEKLKNIIMAGLLHDIGSIKIPELILNKPQRLTQEEREIIKKHPVYGYKLLTETPNVQQDILLGVLLHHERRDGSGYPFGYRNERIPPVARIIAIADIYHAMTTKRTFRAKQTPFDVVREINNDMYQKLDPELCLTFLNNIRDYLIGTIVVLNDGRRAKVVSAGDINSECPVVITEDDVTIDLEEKKDIAIAEFISLEN